MRLGRPPQPPLRRYAHLACVHEGETLILELRRSDRRRTLAVRVDSAAQVVVNAPMCLPEADIRAFVTRHWAWIRARRQALRTAAPAWQDGRRLPFLGDSLRLCLVPPAPGPQVWREAQRLCCSARMEQLGACVGAWYRAAAHTLLAPRLAAHAARLGLPQPRIALSDARSRWGSLTPAGVVRLNWRLVKATWHEIDYVICHELAHLRHRNHSPAFWREVAALYPDWQTAHRRLRENGTHYFEF